MGTGLSRWLASLSAPDADTRTQAAEQLAQLGPDAQPAAVALVLACGDEVEEVRQWATAALEQMGPPEASDVAHLASFLEGRLPDVGYWAATLLGDLRPKVPLPWTPWPEPLPDRPIPRFASEPLGPWARSGLPQSPLSRLCKRLLPIPIPVSPASPRRHSAEWVGTETAHLASFLRRNDS